MKFVYDIWYLEDFRKKNTVWIYMCQYSIIHCGKEYTQSNFWELFSLCIIVLFLNTHFFYLKEEMHDPACNPCCTRSYLLCYYFSYLKTKIKLFNNYCALHLIRSHDSEIQKYLHFVLKKINESLDIEIT